MEFLRPRDANSNEMQVRRWLSKLRPPLPRQKACNLQRGTLVKEPMTSPGPSYMLHDRCKWLARQLTGRSVQSASIQFPCPRAVGKAKGMRRGQPSAVQGRSQILGKRGCHTAPAQGGRQSCEAYRFRYVGKLARADRRPSEEQFK